MDAHYRLFHFPSSKDLSDDIGNIHLVLSLCSAAVVLVNNPTVLLA